MLTPIIGLPDYVLGITATGTVSREDMENVLQPALKSLVDKYDEIYYLLVLKTDVGSFTAGSWLQDMKAGIQNFTKWKKIAVVTDQSAVEKCTDVFSVLVPGESRGFDFNQLDEAIRWISNKES
jgi:hypothetical protein